jgi:hypothetical protein
MFDQAFILSGKMDKQFSKSLHKMFNASSGELIPSSFGLIAC